MPRLAWLLLLLGSAAVAQDTAWPGGVARIDLGPASDAAPAVKFGDKAVLVARQDGRWQAVVGVPLDASLGPATLTIAGGPQRNFEIVAHAYR